MAHFLIPPGADGTGYDVNDALAPGSVWRIQVPARGRKAVALFGGEGLWVKSNNPAAVDDRDTFETEQDGLRVLNFYGKAVGTTLVAVGRGRQTWFVLQVQVVERKTTQKTFIVRDVRLEGWSPHGDVLEVDGATPVRFIMETIRARGAKAGGSMKVIFMAHGLPGFVMCGKGHFVHPQVGAGLTVADLGEFDLLRGAVDDIVFYSCLVARIGTCPECGGAAGYDGNQFCYLVAQRAAARVKASIHLQYYWDGTTGRWIFRRPDGQGMRFGHWNGVVFTWDKTGRIIKREEFPYVDQRPSGEIAD